MDLISTLKHCVPGPLRTPVRKCAYALFPSLRYALRVRAEIDTYTGIDDDHKHIAHCWSEKYPLPDIRAVRIQEIRLSSFDDQTEIESGRVKPTHMLAAMTKQPVSSTKIYKHLSPEFCIRHPRRYFR